MCATCRAPSTPSASESSSSRSSRATMLSSRSIAPRSPLQFRFIHSLSIELKLISYYIYCASGECSRSRFAERPQTAIQRTRRGRQGSRRHFDRAAWHFLCWSSSPPQRNSRICVMRHLGLDIPQLFSFNRTQMEAWFDDFNDSFRTLVPSPSPAFPGLGTYSQTL